MVLDYETGSGGAGGHGMVDWSQYGRGVRSLYVSTYDMMSNSGERRLGLKGRKPDPT
jgi:hypothetical protein